MTIWEKAKAKWRWFASTVVIAVAAICATQINVPVKQSPVVRFVTSNEISLVEPYASTTSIGVVEMDVGTTSDGCSEPRGVWTVLGLNPFSGCSLRAGLTHDAMVQGELTNAATCNLVFREVLLADGVETNKAEIMYRAVVIATDAVWARHTPASIAAARRLVRIREIPQ